MNQLNVSQIIALSQLGDNPSIESTAMVFCNSGKVLITVASKPDASLNEISSEISAIFPHMQRENKPYTVNGTDLYEVSIGDGVNFVLHMAHSREIAPLPEGATEEITLDHLTTFDDIEEGIPIPWTIEEHLRGEA